MIRRISLQSVLVGVLLLGGGCYTVPFRKPVLAPLPRDVAPREVVSRFADKLPRHYQVENTLVFRFFGKEIAALGYAEVDRRNKSFEVLCMNELGVNLFDIAADSRGDHLRYALPQFKKYPGFLGAVAGDIRHIYFGLVPGLGATVDRRKDCLVFTQRDKAQQLRTEFVFGGSGNVLLQKRCFHRGKLIWQISYYQYGTKAGRLVPGGVVLYNRAHRYRLIVRNRVFHIRGTRTGRVSGLKDHPAGNPGNTP